MTDFWRRRAVEAELLQGAASRGPRGTFAESYPGRVVETAVFECAPCGSNRQPARITIQVRTGVVVHAFRVRQSGGDLLDTRWDDLISLSASGGHQDQHYFWVQIVSAEPERLVDFNGRARTENIGRNVEGPPRGPENEFSWSGRRWSVDSVRRDSARYSLAQPTFGSPNCETMYDQPHAPASRSHLLQHHDVKSVSRTSQFHSFLYSLPVLRSERPILPRTQPTATVAWSFDESYEASRRGAEPVRSIAYRVHYVHPNGVAPLGMTRVLWRVFHGR